MSSTLSTNTTAQLIGLAACGAAALGLSLDAALLTRTEDLLAALNAAGLLPTANTAPVAQLATTAPATGQPITTPQSLATGFIPAPPVPGLKPVDGPPDFSALTSAMHR